MATVTPYVFSALTKLWSLTQKQRYWKAALSTAEFMYRGLPQTPLGPDQEASAYTPLDQSRVINVSAYRASCLAEAARLFERPDLEQAALRNVAFILQSQNPDGSWPYAQGHAPDAFIDNLHTCFVLNCLANMYPMLPTEGIRDALVKGFSYYRRALIGFDGMPKPFAKAPRLALARLELYDVAEAIGMGAALQSIVPEAAELSRRLAHAVCSDYQQPQGYFVTRIYAGGWRHTKPYLRWPQSQLFFSLLRLLVLLERSSRCREEVNGHKPSGSDARSRPVAPNTAGKFTGCESGSFDYGRNP